MHGVIDRRSLLQLRIKSKFASSTDLHPGLSPKQIREYLSTVMYTRRSKAQPTMECNADRQVQGWLEVTILTGPLSQSRLTHRI